jgi:hypothetical protein
MRNIAFYGGNAICELGPVSDVVLFFDCVENFAVADRPDLDWSVLTDKLYRRYIDVDFLPVARARMSDVKAAFTHIQSSAVEWNEAMLGNPSKTILNPELGTLADVYARYFEFFDHCAESSSSFHETWGYQVPIRTIVSDMPAMIVATDRPLAEHDALSPNDKPFWLR